MRHGRRGAMILTWAAALIVLGAAFAGATAGTNPVGAGKDSRPEAPPALAGSQGAGEGGGGSEASGAAGDNHGACVSAWAHEAKDQELHGRFFGQFVSEVAQSDETGEDCDFATALGEALDDQEAAPEHGGASASRGGSADAPGRSGEGRGKSSEHRQDGK